MKSDFIINTSNAVRSLYKIVLELQAELGKIESEKKEVKEIIGQLTLDSNSERIQVSMMKRQIAIIEGDIGRLDKEIKSVEEERVTFDDSIKKISDEYAINTTTDSKKKKQYDDGQRDLEKKVKVTMAKVKNIQKGVDAAKKAVGDLMKSFEIDLTPASDKEEKKQTNTNSSNSKSITGYLSGFCNFISNPILSLYMNNNPPSFTLDGAEAEPLNDKNHTQQEILNYESKIQNALSRAEMYSYMSYVILGLGGVGLTISQASHAILQGISDANKTRDVIWNGVNASVPAITGIVSGYCISRKNANQGIVDTLLEEALRKNYITYSTVKRYGSKEMSSKTMEALEKSANDDLDWLKRSKKIESDKYGATGTSGSIGIFSQSFKNKALTDNSGKTYIRYAVVGDGNCGYTAFGVQRNEAFKLLNDNLSKIKKVIDPAIKGALMTDDKFVKYLQSKNIAPFDIVKIRNDINKYDVNDNIYPLYLEYDVRDKQIEGGWSHPCVLQALAEVQGIELHIWKLDNNNNGKLIPNLQFADYKPQNPSGERCNLLFVNNNHFDRLEEIQFKNNSEESQSSTPRPIMR